MEKLLKSLVFKDKKQISFKDAEIIGNEIIDLFNKNQFDKCILFYNNFKNVITQIPKPNKSFQLKTNIRILKIILYHMNLSQTKMKFWKI